MTVMMLLAPICSLPYSLALQNALLTSHALLSDLAQPISQGSNLLELVPRATDRQSAHLSSMGITNAAVLPEPVRAMPTTS